VLQRGGGPLLPIPRTIVLGLEVVVEEVLLGEEEEGAVVVLLLVEVAIVVEEGVAPRLHLEERPLCEE
jgi:hypothetical protein